MDDKRLAVISIIAEDRSSAPEINAVLSEFGEVIIGRMGLPYRERDVYIICVAVDAPTAIINAVTGKIGNIRGVTAKTLMGKAA